MFLYAVTFHMLSYTSLNILIPTNKELLFFPYSVAVLRLIQYSHIDNKINSFCHSLYLVLYLMIFSYLQISSFHRSVDVLHLIQYAHTDNKNTFAQEMGQKVFSSNPLQIVMLLGGCYLIKPQEG